MLRVLRQRMQAHLSMNRIGVLTVAGPEGICAMPVRYRVENLELDCLVPRWADIVYHLERNPGATLIVVSTFPSPVDDRLSWLQYKGNGWPVAAPNWRGLLPDRASEAQAADLYAVIHLVPERIDLLDESKGWGARETLEMGDGHV